jgi:N-acetylglucosaminylphosphatidylinositol deacetylase
MNILEERLKKFWYNDRKRSNNLVDEIDEALLPDAYTHKYTYRSTNMRSFMRLCYWICTRKFLFIMMSFICIPVTLYICLLTLSNNRAFIPIEFQQNQYRLLLIVAHPDDECLFFSPTLRVLQKQYHVNLSLVVFSRGNRVGLGEIRTIELHGSCRQFNIPKERCISLDLPNIQDNPKVWWSEQQLIPIINEYINKWSIDVLVSFDSQGVSGHLNHRAIASAVRLLIQNKTNTMIKMSYELKSVSLLRKYSSILDFYLTFISFIPRLLHSLLSYIVPFNLISSPSRSHILLINTPNDYMASRTAFASHQTQYSWDRYFYLIASRYMFINELKYIDKHV